ncbi:MAG: octaprenyl diphosphate synthase [Gammaproteobacteria bacterium]|nr:octaprenyl diphosphate synthase [Gammaproteobacteria bacterium]
MKLDAIRQLIVTEQARVDQLIIDGLHSDVPLIAEMGHYIINNGGKRLRPLVVLLSALACGYQGSQHCEVAVIIEFIHTATLLHDDVVDKSTLRRGRDTANAVWGDHSSVLVGDFLYSRAFQMMVPLNNMDVMRILADTTNVISEGEVLQLLNAHNADATAADYFQVITCKTAKLFAAAAELGAIIAVSAAIKTRGDAEAVSFGATATKVPQRQDPELNSLQQSLANYGLNLGIAYQLIDDVLDYSSSSEEMGKNVGDDLAEGKLTLPLIHVLKYGNEEQVRLVRTAITEGNIEQLSTIQDAIEDTHALQYTAQQARHYATLAAQHLTTLPNSDYKKALIGLTKFIVQRTY